MSTTDLLRLDARPPDLLIGGRYLTFQTLYGLRAYRVLGSVL